MKEILDTVISLYLEEKKDSPALSGEGPETYLNLFNTGIRINLSKAREIAEDFTLQALEEYSRKHGKKPRNRKRSRKKKR